MPINWGDALTQIVSAAAAEGYGQTGKGGPQVLCKFWLMGACARGPACTFAHGDEASKPPWLKAATEAAQAAVHIPERPIPPWLAAAKGLPTVANTVGSAGKGAMAKVPKGSGRVRVTTSRIQAELVEWNGNIGWLKPVEPIDHPDASKGRKGLLYLSKADVMPKDATLTKGMRVTCFAYTDGMKLGAEGCMEFKGTWLSEEEQVPMIKGKGKDKGTEFGKGKGKGCDGLKGKLASFAGAKGKGALAWQPQWKGGKGYQYWTADDMRAKVLEYKASQSSSSRESRPPTLPRERLTAGAGVTGRVVEWKGSHGFIEPDIPVDHPKAAKRNGNIYIHQKDIIEVSSLYVGQVVNFHIYEDKTGLGAEECIVC